MKEETKNLVQRLVAYINVLKRVIAREGHGVEDTWIEEDVQNILVDKLPCNFTE